MNQTENRAFNRVQVFLLHENEEYVPVWVFNSKMNPSGSLVGLVVDLSESGIQVLTDAREPLSSQQYEITFLTDDKRNVLASPRCRITRVWSQSNGGLYANTGFAFAGNVDGTVKILLDSLRDGSRKFLRCALSEFVEVSDSAD
jgi:hypothetical protein